MKRTITYLIIAIATFTAAAGESYGQQSKTSVVEIDEVKNIVRVENAPSGPLDVKVVDSVSKRQQYQAKIKANVAAGEANKTEDLQIPGGKRFVIENINAYCVCPLGVKVSMQLLFVIDRDGNGTVDFDELMIYRIPFTDSISFPNSTIFSANHKVLLYADERYGTAAGDVILASSVNAVGNNIAQSEVILTGYLEDMPTPAQ